MPSRQILFIGPNAYDLVATMNRIHRPLLEGRLSEGAYTTIFNFLQEIRFTDNHDRAIQEGTMTLPSLWQRRGRHGNIPANYWFMMYGVETTLAGEPLIDQEEDWNHFVDTLPVQVPAPRNAPPPNRDPEELIREHVRTVLREFQDENEDPNNGPGGAA